MDETSDTNPYSPPEADIENNTDRKPLTLVEKIVYIFFNWQGRLSRASYWLFTLPFGCIYLVAEFYVTLVNTYLYIFLMLLVIYPSMMVNIKRSHDRGRSGWFVLLLLVPILSLWPMIELAFIKGKDEDNPHGIPDPIWN